MIPVPTPEQAVHVLEILEQWTKRGGRYEADPKTNPAPGEIPPVFIRYSSPFSDGTLGSRGINHFDALCQATTVMQMLLEEHPEKT